MALTQLGHVSIHDIVFIICKQLWYLSTLGPLYFRDLTAPTSIWKIPAGLSIVDSLFFIPHFTSLHLINNTFLKQKKKTSMRNYLRTSRLIFAFLLHITLLLRVNFHHFRLVMATSLAKFSLELTFVILGLSWQHLWPNSPMLYFVKT